MKPVTEMTLSELERVYALKKEQLEALLARRAMLERQLEKVNRRIAQVQGAPSRVNRRVRKRVRNSESLQAVVLHILRTNKKGLTLSELQEKVLKSGYQTTANSFRDVLYQCVYKMYKTSEVAYDDHSGRYVAKA